MRCFRYQTIFSTALLLIVTGSSLSPISALAQERLAQTQPTSSSAPISHDSVEVAAHLSPEDVEEGKLNDAYESVAEKQRKGICNEEIVDQYKSGVLRLAEKSSFSVPKNKFLFLANRDIGSCYLVQQKFVEAETAFKKILQYVPVWPGTDDSAYPINFRQIATAQMGQRHWQAAEESLQKSISLLDPQIDNASKSESEFTRTGHAGNLRGAKATSLAYLGIVYMQEGRADDALKAADLAFAEASNPNVSPTVVSRIVNIGRSIAQASGNKDAIATWLRRA